MSEFNQLTQADVLALHEGKRLPGGRALDISGWDTSSCTTFRDAFRVAVRDIQELSESWHTRGLDAAVAAAETPGKGFPTQ